MGPEVAGVPFVGILRLPFESPEIKCHLNVAPVERHREYYKGEVMASPNSGPW
jgi:hypothetical protein